MVNSRITAENVGKNNAMKVGQRKKVSDSVLKERTHRRNFVISCNLLRCDAARRGTTGSPHLRLHWAGHWVFGSWAVSEFSVHNMQWGYQTQVVQTQAHAAHFAASTRIQISPQGGALPSWIRSLGCFMLFWPVLCCVDPPHFDPFKVESRPGSPGFAPGKVASSCWPAGQVDFVWQTKSIKILWELGKSGILVDFLLPRAKAFKAFQTFNTFDVFSFVVTLSPLKF